LIRQTQILNKLLEMKRIDLYDYILSRSSYSLKYNKIGGISYSLFWEIKSKTWRKSGCEIILEDKERRFTERKIKKVFK